MHFVARFTLLSHSESADHDHCDNMTDVVPAAEDRVDRLFHETCSLEPGHNAAEDKQS
jgi:hypothetical protein